LPNSLRLPCIGSWLLRSPRRTVTWPLPPLWVSKVQPLEASSRLSSCAFITYNLFHSSVEVHKDVEFGTSLGFACNSRASSVAESHPIPMQPRALGRKQAMNSRSRSAACITGLRIAPVTNAPGGRLLDRFYPDCAQTLEADARGGGSGAARCDHTNARVRFGFELSTYRHHGPPCRLICS